MTPEPQPETRSRTLPFPERTFVWLRPTGGKGAYAKVIAEFNEYVRLSDDRNSLAFASAMAKGYREGGWKGALSKALEARLAQRKNAMSPPRSSLRSTPTWEIKTVRSNGWMRRIETVTLAL
jgi:hypothetical protein